MGLPATASKASSGTGVCCRLLLVTAIVVGVVTAVARPDEKPAWSYAPEDLWAFRPLKPVRVPALQPGWVHANPVDAFVNRRLADRGLTPAPPADPATLLRRVYFDLLGLPPDRASVERFLADPRPDRWERLIDRLLASPRYGEQWARHWLDVVRYADTAGYSNDFERPNAWRYRDYVIRSFNADKPFDRFALEQIAGDELEPDNPEMKIAVGFLRMGPWEHTGMSVEAVTRQAWLDDVTNAVGVTFLGLTLRCARCHDHKFDPIPTRDYYAVQACFATTHFVEHRVPFLAEENRLGFDAARRVFQERLRYCREQLDRIERKHREAVARFLAERGLRSLKELPLEKRPTRLFGLDVKDRGLQRMFRKWIAYYQRALRRFEPYALSVYNGPSNHYSSVRLDNPPKEPAADDRPPRVRVLMGGDLASLGPEVEPGVVGVVATFGRMRPVPIPRGWSGRRLALARWITAEDNPLTPRVIANRVWQHHFANLGIVRTPNNFGKMGAKPTHPELLDFLAAYLKSHGWSLKRLHRLILTSVTYRRDSTHPRHPEVARVDPPNELLAYYPPRRLQAEELRDALLFASGELNLEMGGPGVFEEINWDVALQPRHIMGTVAPAYQPSPKRDQRHRRSIYLFRIRTLRDPFLEVFNQPDGTVSCPVREESTVTPQVFALFNSKWAYCRALAMAAGIARTTRRPEDAIIEAFRRAFARDPNAHELGYCLAHYRKMLAHYRQVELPRWDAPTSVERRMIEEVEGVEYTWREELFEMAQYEPDLSPADLPPDVNALADVCHVLLNSNEFVYVY